MRRLPIVPLAVPIQLVLGLDNLGIKPKRIKRRTWLRPTGRAA